MKHLQSKKVKNVDIFFPKVGLRFPLWQLLYTDSCYNFDLPPAVVVYG